MQEECHGKRIASDCYLLSLTNWCCGVLGCRQTVDQSSKNKQQSSVSRFALQTALSETTSRSVTRNSPPKNKRAAPIVMETIESDDEDESDVIFVSQEKARRQKPSQTSESSLPSEASTNVQSVVMKKSSASSPNLKAPAASAPPGGGAINSSGGGAFKRHMVLLQKRKAASEEDGGGGSSSTATVPAPPSLLEVWANCSWEGIRANLLKEMARLTLETAHPAPQTLSIGEFSVEILPESGVRVRVPAHMNLRETEMFPIQLRITPLPEGSVVTSSKFSPSKSRTDTQSKSRTETQLKSAEISADASSIKEKETAKNADAFSSSKATPGPKPMVRPTGISGLSQLKVSIRRQTSSSLPPLLPAVQPPPVVLGASSWRDERARVLAKLADRCLDDAYSSFLGASGETSVDKKDLNAGVISLVDEEDSGSNSGGGVCEIQDNDSDDCIMCDESQSTSRCESTEQVDVNRAAPSIIPIPRKSSETSSLAQAILAVDSSSKSSSSSASNAGTMKALGNRNKVAGGSARRAVTIPLNIRNQLGEPVYVLINDSSSGQTFNCKFQPIIPVYNLSEDSITFVITLQELTKDGTHTGRPKIFHATSTWGLAGERTVSPNDPDKPSEGQSTVDQQISYYIRRFSKRIADRGRALMEEVTTSQSTFYSTFNNISTVPKIRAANVFSSASEVGAKIPSVSTTASSPANSAGTSNKTVNTVSVLTPPPLPRGAQPVNTARSFFFQGKEVRLRPIVTSNAATRPPLIRTVFALPPLVQSPTSSCAQPAASDDSNRQRLVLSSNQTRQPLVSSGGSSTVPPRVSTSESAPIRFRLPTLTSNPTNRLVSPSISSVPTIRTIRTIGNFKTAGTTGTQPIIGAPQPIEIAPNSDDDTPAESGSNTPPDYDLIAERLAQAANDNLQSGEAVSDSSNDGSMLAGVRGKFASRSARQFRDDSGVSSVSHSALSNEDTDDCVIEDVRSGGSNSSIAAAISRGMKRVATEPLEGGGEATVEKRSTLVNSVPRSTAAAAKSEVLARVLRDSLDGPSRIQLSITRRPDGTIDTTSPVSLAKSKAAASTKTGDTDFASTSRKRLAADFDAVDESDAADVDVDVLNTDGGDADQDIRQQLMVDCARKKQVKERERMARLQGAIAEFQSERKDNVKVSPDESLHRHKRLAKAPHRFREVSKWLLFYVHLDSLISTTLCSSTDNKH